MKPDWTRLVREHLKNSPSPCSHDVIVELATHFEEVYDQARATGSSDTAALRRTLQEVEDWDVLATEIARSKSQEDSMNNNAMSQRTKNILLPAIAILFAIGLVLLFLDRAAALQMFIWIACMGLLLFAAASEASRLNLRTRSVWLPGFVSLVAASLFLFAEELVLVHDSSFYFTDISLRPAHLIFGMPRWFYIAWLVAQVLCGALGASLSRRGGGNCFARLASGSFPALVMFAVCTIVIPASAMFEHNHFIFHNPGRLWMGVLIWAAVPALAMLLGAAPFLKEATVS